MPEADGGSYVSCSFIWQLWPMALLGFLARLGIALVTGSELLLQYRTNFVYGSWSSRDSVRILDCPALRICWRKFGLFSRRSSVFNYLATFLCVLPADGRVPFLQDDKLFFCRIWYKRRICCIFLCLAWYRFGIHFFLPCKSVYRVHMKCLSFNISLSHITLLIRLRAFAEISIKIMIISAV